MDLEMEFKSAIDFHRNNPEQSLESHYKNLRLELSNNVIDKKVIYLDTKFWVLLRDAILFPDKDLQVTELLKTSEFLNESNKCIFPISEDVFLEVLKQTDLRTLTTTVALIDKLSNGISLINFDERVMLEVMNFLGVTTGKPVHETKELVWTKFSYILGFNTCSISSLGKAENLMLQKSFVDEMWNKSLLQILEDMKGIEFLRKFLNSTFGNNLNEGKLKHQHEASSFQQMFLNEIGGIVDVYKEDLAQMMVLMIERENKLTFSEEEIKPHHSETMRLMKNTIYNLFRLNKVGSAMPALQISAALYASVRWDKKQNFQDHDFHDFRHATAALPYCDYFFTEKRLAHLVTQNNLGYDKVYKCQVQSKVKDALSLIKNIK